MSAIKPGDLVLVAGQQPCCGGDASSGHAATVLELYMVGGCRDCNYNGPQRAVAWLSSGKRILVSRLIKIDPPAEMKDTETEKELTV